MKLDDIIKHLENLKATDPRFEKDLLEVEIDIDCESGNIWVASQVQGERLPLTINAKRERKQLRI